MTHPTNQGSSPLIFPTEQIWNGLQALKLKIEKLTYMQNEREHQENLADEEHNMQQQDIDARIDKLEKKLNDFQKTAIRNIWMAFIAGLVVGFLFCSLYSRNWQILSVSSF